MTMRDPELMWNKLKELYSAVSEAAIDAKLTRQHQIQMGYGEPVMNTVIVLMH